MSEQQTGSLDEVMARAGQASGARRQPPRPAAPSPVVDSVDEALGAEEPQVSADVTVAADAPAAPAPVAESGVSEPQEAAPVQQPVAKKAAAVVVEISDNDILASLGSLQLHDALKRAVQPQSPAFKVAALQSGYTAEMTALSFEDITRLQASALDAHAARMKLLKTLHQHVQEFSCGPIKFQDWLKMTAQGDYDTLMYGMYAATYPGENEFDVSCQHCGHQNKVTADVGAMARVESDEVYGEIRKLLDPRTDFKGAIQNSLVGRVVRRRLPLSGIVAEIRNPSMQDYLDGVQWYVQMQDPKTGMLPVELAGAETIRTLAMYVTRLLVPVPGTSQFAPISETGARISALNKLNQTDGQALVDAVDEESKSLDVSYQLPDYNCAACGKRSEKLYVDFETLLFIKLRAKA